MNIFQGFRKLLFCVIAACTGMVVGYQLSRVLFLGIGAVCAVILGILAFRFYRAGLFLVCAVLMFFVIKTLLHREDWWVYPVSSLAALAAGYSVFLLEKPAEIFPAESYLISYFFQREFFGVMFIYISNNLSQSIIRLTSARSRSRQGIYRKITNQISKHQQCRAVRTHGAGACVFYI